MHGTTFKILKFIHTRIIYAFAGTNVQNVS